MKFSKLRYVVTQDNLLQMKNHKYDCRGKGFLEKFVDKFAKEVVVPRMPTWLAPNTITLMGFLCHLIAACLVIFNDQASFAYIITTKKSLCYIFSLLFYMTMDSADGAQARRIGASSPLGELFDHGADAITMSLVLMSVCSLLRFSYFRTRLYITCVGGMFLFFVTHWRAYSVGYLQFGLSTTDSGLFRFLSRVDAFEGVFGVIFLFIMNILFGFDFFWFELPTPELLEEKFLRRMEVADLMFFTIVAFAAYVILKRVYEIVYQQGAVTFAGLSTVSPMPWCGCAMILSLLNYCLVSYFLYDFLPHFLVINITVPFIKLSWVVMLCYMGRCNTPALDTCLLWPLLLLFWFLLLRYGFIMDYITRPNFVFNFLAIMSVGDFFYFAASNIYIISRRGDYPVFTVKSSYTPTSSSSLPV